MTADCTTPAADKVDRREDETVRQSMADLSRRLGERAARQSAVDPGAAAAARRAALQAYDRVRARRLRLVLGVAIGAAMGSGIAYLAAPLGSLPVPPSSSAAAPTEPAPSLSMATATPAPAPPGSPSPLPAASVPSTPAVEPAAAQAVAADSRQDPVEPARSQTTLRPDEVREVQTRLRSFGFNPGPLDGAAGRMTESAVMHYQQNRGHLQTGTVDRRLMEQLRQDPAPQVAQQVAKRAVPNAAGPAPRATSSPGARRSDPFEPVRAAGDRFGQWLGSLTR
jgi:hypothetical protein